MTTCSESPCNSAPHSLPKTWNIHPSAGIYPSHREWHIPACQLHALAAYSLPHKRTSDASRRGWHNTACQPYRAADHSLPCRAAAYSLPRKRTSDASRLSRSSSYSRSSARCRNSCRTQEQANSNTNTMVNRQLRQGLQDSCMVLTCGCRMPEDQPA